MSKTGCALHLFRFWGCLLPSVKHSQLRLVMDGMGGGMDGCATWMGGWVRALGH